MTQEIKDVWDALAMPFEPDQIKQRPGRGGMTFDYVDARDVMNRLDLALGPEHWQFEAHTIDNNVVHGRLLVRVADGWVVREDFGYPNSDDDEEPVKSAASDALKRCAVHIGVGRHLYEKKPRAASSPSGSRAAAPRPAAAPAPQLIRTDAEGTPTDVCPVHLVAWAHKTGVAKTSGKPYDFWACSEKDADGKFCKQRPPDGWKPATADAVLDDVPF